VSLSAGRRLGPYEIVAPLGAGGMGEVYRAKDTKLHREVAIKVLPVEVGQDAERLARFRREAQVLASLNHRNIAAIYGLDEAEGELFLVLELVEGEDLAVRLKRGRVPLDETIAIARQIAEALEEAHDKGIVHRDLKPANIKITPDGTVKVLDFGLAKAIVEDTSGSGATSTPTILPTMTSAGTAIGMILGTAAYMSPEQARGRPVDRRADIWAFGVVLFEMLTGERLFDGETASETIAAVIKDDVPWTALPSGTPSPLRRLLERCLTRDPKLRLQSIGEARIALAHPHAPDTVPGTDSRRPALLVWTPWILLLLFGAFVTWRGLLSGGASAPESVERRIELAYPKGNHAAEDSPPSISPDGRWIVVPGTDANGAKRLWLRSLDEFEYRPLKGTEGAVFAVWSPDSRSVAFIAHGGLRRLDVPGGVVETILPEGVGSRGASWGPDGTILYSPSANAALWRVAATGGVPTQVTQLDPKLIDGSHRFPAWLGDGEHFLFAIWSNNAKELAASGGVYVGSIRGGEPQRILKDGGMFLFLPAGQLLFHREGNLMTVPFATSSRQTTGQAVVLAEHVRFWPAAGIVHVSASARDDVVFAEPVDRPPAKLHWLDRHGVARPAMELPRPAAELRISPDGTRFAATLDGPSGLSEIWVGELERGTISPLTRSLNDSFAPVWSPDGDRIAFDNRDTGTEDLYIQAASGTRPKEKVLEVRTVDADLRDWTRDGRYLLFEGRPREGAVRSQIWMNDLQAGSARALIQEDYNVENPALSPDGRWLAYDSDESGRFEVYVRSFPDLERKLRVSTAGGRSPHWKSDGRELVFDGEPGGERVVWAASMAPSPGGVAIGEPVRLFALTADQLEVAPSPDHSRFLAVIQAAELNEPPLRMIQGWHSAPATR
jgi:serine/threonine protein kinase/Tol biopolymer transport system component